ncbi:histone-like nucleoid-structuring protein Lsr2 [Streptomyces sp. CAU 1734]
MNINWDAIEARLGTPLPHDYKQLADQYGPGTFADYIHLFHPHGATEYVNLTGPVPTRIREQLRKDHQQGTHPVPYHPDQLLACGTTSNGEYLFWITDPATHPDHWHIAVNEARGPRWHTHHGTITHFLLSVLTGQEHVPQFPTGLLDTPPAFTPSHPTLWKPEPITDQPPTDTAAIRTWARANGYDVPLRGRIPPHVREAWQNAQTP